MQIGPYRLSSNLLLAPMAGITDRPFRELCRGFGAGLAVSEMVASSPHLRDNRRTLLKADHAGEMAPKSVQIVGADPEQMADAARYNVARGAQIIDINMGCPAKKVCSVAAGSALMKNEALVGEILHKVVGAVDVPVTLKIRTGWDIANRNAVAIARLAEQAGIAALAIHGRTRACGFAGAAEYETIRAVKQSVGIPVVANGDIDSPAKALAVLSGTGADALMVGRAARGRPWIFRDIAHFMRHRVLPPALSLTEIHAIVTAHLQAIYSFYGNAGGVKIARKHIGWYCNPIGELPERLRQGLLHAERADRQLTSLDAAFVYYHNTGIA